MKRNLKELQKPKLPKSWGKVEGTNAFNPVNYSDGTPSREVEDDWETSGEEEMQRLFEGCRRETSRLEVSDRLSNIVDLVTVCREALSDSSLIDIKTVVVNVLYFHVEEQLKLAQEELTNL